jgi:hypothetical protein
MAKALIINDPYGELARTYYAKFPQEPVSAKTILPVEDPKLVDQMSMDTLLTAILKTFNDKKAGSDLVIASHGNKNGMLMGLYPGHPKKAVTSNLQVLMGGESRDKKADFLSLKPDLVDQLIGKMEAVRKIGLGHIAFRGCTIGENPFNLSTLKDFLGASVVSGTGLLSTYGNGIPKYVKDKKKFDALVKRFEHSGSVYDGSARVILATSPGKEAYTEIVYFYLESEDVLLEWLQTHVVAGTTKAAATSVKVNTPLHWLSRKPPVLPLDGVSKKGGATIGYADFIRDTNETP